MIGGGTNPTSLHTLGDHRFELRLNHRRLALVDEVHFGRIRIDPDDLMSIPGKAPGQYRAHIAQPKNTDFQFGSFAS